MVRNQGYVWHNLANSKLFMYLIMMLMWYEKYQGVEELIEDYLDLQDLRKAKSEEQDLPSVPLHEVIEELKKN